MRPLPSLAALLLLACAARADTLVQFSTIDALMQGIYDGPFTFADLKKQGDFGLGTLNNLDGEMIGLDGVFYRIAPDGAATPIPDTAHTPFAAVTFFHPGKPIPLRGIASLADLEQLIDRQLPSLNFPCAIRVTGTFPVITARSVVRQSPPYRPLTEVVKGQSVFHLANVHGTLVGFRSPAYLRSLNVPGYHLHFLSDDHRHGGHLLDCAVAEGTLSLDPIDTIQAILPHDPAFLNADLSTHDEAAVNKVEKLGPAVK